MRQALRVPLPRLTILMIERNTLKNGKNKILRTWQKAAGPAIRHKRGDPAQKRPARANRTQIESSRSLTRTQSPRLIKEILRIQNKISYAYKLLRDGWAQRTISHALQEGHYFVPRHVSRKSLNYMHTKYLKIDF